MKLVLKPVLPFAFDLSATIFSEGDQQIRRFEDGRFWQVVRVSDKLVLIDVSSCGTVDEPRLSVEAKCDKELFDEDKRAIIEKVSSLFNLDFDVRPFYEFVRSDAVMTTLTCQLRGLRGPTTASVFEALVDSIVEQQIALNVAHSLEAKLVKTCGDTLNVNGEAYYAYPTAERLASVTVEELRACGLSYRKAEYIKGSSKLVAGGKLDLEKLKDCEDSNAIIRKLDSIKGVGVWTAELTMVRGLRRMDVLPADDLSLRRVIAHYYCGDRRIGSQEARRIAEKWGKWKGLASFYLIVAERLGLKA